jgi:hypothetical protein
MVPGQLGKNVWETPISVGKIWVWWYIHVIPAMPGSLKEEAYHPGQPK